MDQLIQRLFFISVLLLLAACTSIVDQQPPLTPVVESTPSIASDTPTDATDTLPTVGPDTVSPTAGTDSQQPSEPEVTGLVVPSTCLHQQEGRSPFVNYTGGYCLQYPASFRVGDVFPEGAPNAENILGIYGPPQDASLEPLQAGLSILVIGPVEGRTLQQVVDEAVLTADSGPEITTRITELGGERAVIVEGLQGRSPYRDLLTIHEGKIYELTVYPTGDDYPEVVADVELVWQTVLDTFTFLTEDVLAEFESCPQQAAPYANLAAGYCLRYPSSFNLHQMADSAAVTLAAPALLREDPDSAGAMLTVGQVDVTQDRTLQALADEIVAGYRDEESRQSAGMLGGEPALVVESLLGGKRQLLAIHNGSLYRLTLLPADRSVPEAVTGSEQLWDTVTGSFTFLPKLD